MEREKYRNIARDVHVNARREYIYCKTGFIRYCLSNDFVFICTGSGGEKENIELDRRGLGPRRGRRGRGKKTSVILAGTLRSRFFSRNKPLKLQTKYTRARIYIYVCARIHFFFSNRCVLSKSVFVFCT